jgi:purine-binding chemotaxis protein CheW
MKGGMQVTAFQVVVFRLGAEHFGVDARQVQSIERYERPVPVPHTLPSLKGVISLRGQALPVLDLGEQFGLRHSEESDDEGKLLVVRIEDMPVALRVDDVMDIESVDESGLEPPPDLVGGVEARYLHGIYTRGPRPLVLLNLERVLSDTEAEQLRLVEERVRG